MRRFRSWDGTELAYRVAGSGPPLVCIPGGPGQAVEYLGTWAVLAVSGR
jgi:pimeloyl-ACP methyl ester carboxylesterase